MRTETITLYQFNELPTEAAKENAREWYRQHCVWQDSWDWEAVYEDADQIASLMGISINRRTYRTVGGKACSEPAIYFSGFCSQGDGACFEGSYRFKKGAVRAVEDYAQKDEELSRIVRSLYRIQRRYFYKLRAEMTHSGHYYHSGCMRVEVEHEERGHMDNGDVEDLVQLMRDFADWIYERLEEEYDYQMSDESIDENLINNEYEFLENGDRA